MIDAAKHLVATLNKTIKKVKSYMGMKNETKQSKKQKIFSRQAEANARRKVSKNWAFLANGVNYRKAAVKESCQRTTLLVEDELFDGIFLNLHVRNSVKPCSEQKRILRRIVEKRQAQQTHHNVGRTNNRTASYLLQYCTSRCMAKLYNYQQCV